MWMPNMGTKEPTSSAFLERALVRAFLAELFSPELITTYAGWMNASYELGLTFINQHQRRALGALTPPETLFNLPQVTQRK